MDGELGIGRFGFKCKPDTDKRHSTEGLSMAICSPPCQRGILFAFFISSESNASDSTFIRDKTCLGAKHVCDQIHTRFINVYIIYFDKNIKYNKQQVPHCLDITTVNIY